MKTESANPITRKTLVRKIGGDMSEDRLRKNERRWGLSECRANTGTRAVLYREAQAIVKLRERGLA